MTDMDALKKQWIAALGKDGRDLKKLEAILQGTNSELNWKAAVALGELGNKLAVEPLVDAALKGSVHDDRLRRSSIEAIQQLGGEQRAAERFAAALTNDSADLREKAAWALGSMPSAAAIDRLVACLADKEEHVREAAMWALLEAARAGMFSNIELFAKAMKDASFGVRGKAAHALGLFGDSAHVDLLIAALQHDDSEYVRSEAAEALGNLGDKRAHGPLQLAESIANTNSDFRVLAATQEALRKLGQ